MPDSTLLDQSNSTQIPVLNCKTKQIEYIVSTIAYGRQNHAILAPNGDIWGTPAVQTTATDEWCVFTSLQKQDFDETMTISPLGSN